MNIKYEKETPNVLKYSLLEPDDLRELINQLPQTITFLYAMHSVFMQNIITKETGKTVKDFSKLRLVWFRIQVLTYFLQNFKHFEKVSGFFLQAAGDSIACLPYPVSYFKQEDVISHRKINYKQASEILMLFSATGTDILLYFFITGQRHIVVPLAAFNKTTFWIAQVLKAKNINSLDDQDPIPPPHGTEK